MKPFILLLLCAFINDMSAQFNGTYLAKVNGDDVTMILQQSGNAIKGSMKDSQQNYEVTGTAQGNQLEIKAVDKTYGITLDISGVLSGSNINMVGYLNVLGLKEKAFESVFVQNKANNSQKTQTTASNDQLPSEIKGKSIDPMIIGLWREESHYNSSGFSGSTYKYSAFNNNHTMSDHGSQATMSGADYSGNSGGRTSGTVIPNLWYYTSNGKIWVVIIHNGERVHTELGTYYIENNKMMFTQANTGNKILYTKM
jgi:hypothetical protein